jgi:CubicO group peptidase (beta-lactamase class C family)
MTPSLPRSAPEAQGIASPAILAFVRAAEAGIDHLHSLMLVRHGHVVAEGWWAPYGPTRPHTLFSLSKSYCSTAVGLAVADGLLSVDDPVLSFFPEDAPTQVGEHLAAMRVRHLLSMSTGHAEDTTGYMHRCEDSNWARAFLARPVDHEPGTHFVYNSGATYMLSAIVQKLTGATVVDYLGPRLFAPLGIEPPTWESCPRGINFGGWGLAIKTEDIARFGQLYLQKGLWQGQRLVPESWIDEATSRQVSNGSRAESDWEQGYGYQFWRCRHGAYRGDGAFGQFCIVMPGQDAVLTITSGTGDMQGVLNLVWEHLLPAMAPVALPADAVAQSELAATLADLALRPPAGAATSPRAAKGSGRTYRVAANDATIEALTPEFDAHTGAGAITIQDARGAHRIAWDHGRWLLGTTTYSPEGLARVGCAGAWTDDDTCTVRICSYETPFCPTLTLRFGDEEMTFHLKMNVSFGDPELPPLVGHLA